MRENILKDLADIGNPRLLYQIWEFINLIKKNSVEKEGNVEKVLAYAGSLDREEGKIIQLNLEEEFNKIEGDWD